MGVWPVWLALGLGSELLIDANARSEIICSVHVLRHGQQGAFIAAVRKRSTRAVKATGMAMASHIANAGMF